MLGSALRLGAPRPTRLRTDRETPTPTKVRKAYQPGHEIHPSGNPPLRAINPNRGPPNPYTHPLSRNPPPEAATGSTAMSTTAPLSVQIIVPGAELLLRYAEQLVTSAPADSFARMPMKDVNSAAFNIGHLSTYGDRVCAMLGRNDLITPMPYSVDLFKAGAPCLDQPGLYPEKDVLVATFFERQRRAIEAFRGTTDAALAAENPAEGRFKEMFPTVGGAVAFLLGGHVAMHLGQVSTWRRVMGLGSVG